MKTFILLICSVLLFIQVPGAQNTWLGGYGYWEDAANWSYGTVPASSDDVEIPSGGIKVTTFYAVANSVWAHPNTELIIPKGTRLSISGGGTVYGMQLDGITTVNGYLILDQINSNSAIWQSQSGTFSVGTAGIVNIRDCPGKAFQNVGEVINRGFFSIKNIGNNAFLNYGMIKNLGGEFSMLNVGGAAFYGYAGSTANGGSMINDGEINLKGCGGIVVPEDASFYNEQGATIVMSYNEGSISIVEDAYFENSGSISIYQSIPYLPSSIDAISNRGDLINTTSGTISVEKVNYGVYNHNSGILENQGLIDIIEATYDGIRNRGDFNNDDCGVIHLPERIVNEPAADFMNRGWIFNTSPNNMLNSGAFENRGVIEDNPETIYPFINNLRIVTRPITGTVQQGVPVSNALELGSLSGFTVNGWYTNSNATISAGSYNSTLNEWTPNATAVGLNQVFVKIRYSNQCNEVFAVDIPGGVQPFSSSDEESLAIQQDVYEQLVARLQLYPNPSKGQVHIVLPPDFKDAQRLEVYNGLGVLVLEHNLVSVSSFSVDLSDQPAGMYWIQLYDNSPLGTPQAISITK